MTRLVFALAFHNPYWGSHVRTRTISAIALLIPVVLLLWLGGLPWLVAIILVALAAVQELFSALRHKGHRPLILVQVLAAAALPVAAYADGTLALLAPVMTLLVLLSLSALLLRRNLEGALGDWAVSLAGSIYISLLLAHFVALRQRPDGLAWILLAFLCTWLCDSAAYLVGRAIGRRPFSPLISPKKTWEGTLGGVAAGALTGLVGVPLLGLAPIAGLLLGLGAAVAAVAGDLAESLIKRQLGIKDSGTLIPGHGGVLDRVDSLLFAVPLVFYAAALLSVS
jgi:phosphatidate cytidylyltransferase